jgi:multidrug efflux pump subunit AcrA (membrane-fusion protein)
LRSSIPGLVGLIHVGEGALLEAGMPLVEVSDFSAFSAEVLVSQRRVSALAVGDDAEVIIEGIAVPGRVRSVAPRVEMGSVPVMIDLSDALPPGARPQLAVECTIFIEQIADTLYVARPAEVESPGVYPLFVVDPEGGRARRTEVTLGRVSAAEVEILSGAGAGDRIVISETRALGDHDAIRIR